MSASNTLIEWVRRGLALPGKTQAGLARAIGKDPATITKILNGKRKIQASEIAPIARYFGLQPPAVIPYVTADSSRQVSVVGSISSGFFQIGDIPTVPRDRRISPVLDKRYPIDRQRAWLISVDVDVLGIPADGAVITVPIDEYRTAPLERDIAVTEVRKGDMVGYGLARFEDGRWVHICGATGGNPVALSIQFIHWLT